MDNPVTITINFLKLFHAWLLIFFEAITFPFEMLLRRDFGERYLSALRLVFALVAVHLTVAAILILDLEPKPPVQRNMWEPAPATSMKAELGTTIDRMQPTPDILLIEAMGPVMMATFLLHSITIARRNRRFEICHSKYEGQSWGIWKLVLPRKLRDAYTLHRVIEPILLALVGIIIHQFFPLFGYFILAAGIAMFLKGRVKNARERIQLLDAIDSYVEAEMRPQMLKKWTEPSVHETMGMAMPPLLQGLPTAVSDYWTTTASLPQELKKLLSPVLATTTSLIGRPQQIAPEPERPDIQIFHGPPTGANSGSSSGKSNLDRRDPLGPPNPSIDLIPPDDSGPDREPPGPDRDRSD